MRVNPDKEVVSDIKMLVSSDVLMEKEGVSTVVSVSLLEIAGVSLGVGVRLN